MVAEVAVVVTVERGDVVVETALLRGRILSKKQTVGTRREVRRVDSATMSFAVVTTSGFSSSFASSGLLCQSLLEFV